MTTALVLVTDMYRRAKVRGQGVPACVADAFEKATLVGPAEIRVTLGP